MIGRTVGLLSIAVEPLNVAGRGSDGDEGVLGGVDGGAAEPLRRTRKGVAGAERGYRPTGQFAMT